MGASSELEVIRLEVIALEVIGLDVTWLPAFTGTIELLYVQNGDELRMDAAN